MGSVLKGNRYRLVDNRSFDLPLPLKYELLKEDSPVAVYEVSEDEKVTCSIVTKYKEEMITPIYRPLDISDIYYFFSCRVFQDRTPFTLTELSLLGLEKYNVYDIIRKTRGVTPYDTYWLRFEGDSCDYDTARGAWDSLMQQAGVPGAQKASESSALSAPKSDANVGEILNQHKVDIAAKFAAKNEISKEELGEPEHVSNNTMSADEIEALLLKSGLTDLSQPDEAPAEPEPAEEKKSSGGMMSEEEIAAMLAAAAAPEAEAPAEPEPAEEKKSSGGMMSEDEIAALLAAAAAPEAEAPAEPEPAEEKKSSGGMMSEEEIAAMLAAAAAPEAEAPAEPEPAAPELNADISAILDAVEAEPVPEPTKEKPSGGKMSQADIEAMLAAAGAPETEAAPEPDAPAEPEPAPAETKPSGGKMSQADIEAMLAAAAGAVEPAVEEAAEAVQETLEEAAPESAGGKMSEADIEALLNGMKEDAST